MKSIFRREFAARARQRHLSCPGRGAAFFTLLRRAGIVTDAAFVTTPALLRTASRCAASGERGQNRVAAEALKTHARRSRDLTYGLAAESRQAAAKLGQETGFFDLISITLKYLWIVLALLKRLATALRQTKGKLAASVFRLSSACGRIWIFAWRRDGDDRFVILADAIKLRKIFRREAARRQCFVEHARKLNGVPEMTAAAAARALCE